MILIGELSLQFWLFLLTDAQRTCYRVHFDVSTCVYHITIMLNLLTITIFSA